LDNGVAAPPAALTAGVIEIIKLFLHTSGRSAVVVAQMSHLNCFFVSLMHSSLPHQIGLWKLLRGADGNTISLLLIAGQ